MIESLLKTIEGLLAVGFVAGLLVGITVTRQKIGCIILLIVPVLMIFYIGWWQSQHPASIRSTSALDYIFGPLWPSVGAVCGYYTGLWLRFRFNKRR